MEKDEIRLVLVEKALETDIGQRSRSRPSETNIGADVALVGQRYSMNDVRKR